LGRDASGLCETRAMRAPRVPLRRISGTMPNALKFNRLSAPNRADQSELDGSQPGGLHQ
jgi:hypothetical protein